MTGDYKRLVQVIGNLLTNAAKYTPEGGNIHLRMDVVAHQVTLTVEDDGIGMTPQLSRHAFDLFSQAAQTSDRSAGGLGLGLALVKSLVELHRGSVTCSSQGLGMGSRFTVCLPQTIDCNEAVDRQPRDEAFPALEPLKILIVDDNADAAQMLSMYLEAAGHSVIVELGSRAAFERARVEQFDVCLLDIGLPEMDGNELAQLLRSCVETMKAVLIAVTGYGGVEDKKRSLDAGFDHHMTKPINITELTGMLSAIGRRPIESAVI